MTPHTPQDTTAIDPTLGLVDFGAVLNNLPVCVMVADRNLTIRFRNRAAHALLPTGSTLDDAFVKVKFLGRFDGWADEIARVAASGEPRTVECVVPQCSGARPALLAGGLTRMDEPNAAGSLVIVWLDRRAATDTIDDQLELTQRLTSLGRVAARVAHELNNPLDGILRYINLALRTLDGPSPESVRSYLSESRTGLMRMVQIIGDLLEFSRCTEGEFDNVCINHVIEQAIQANAAVAEGNKVVVAADFHSAEMPSIRGGRLFQVLCNLIKNALDAMPEGGRLTITSGVTGGEVVIQVSDTGPGLSHPPETIFEPFFTTKATGEGTGLGLAISRDFMEDMGGTIAATNQPNGGAVFTVRLPVDRCLPSSHRLQQGRAERENGTDAAAGDPV